MSIRRILCGVGLSFLLVCASSALASASTHSIHDGFYSRKGTGPGFSAVQVFVGANGKEVIGGVAKSGGSCTASPALQAQYPNVFESGVVVGISLPHNIPISASGTFSFTGDAHLILTATVQSTGFTEPITFTGHFTKGTVIAHKTVAVVGSLSAPSICESQTPSAYSDEWDVNDN